MTNFYTYIHIRNDSDSIFYVGKGKEDRANSKRGRNKHWNRIVEKCGYTVEILDRFDSEDDAFAHERYLISSFRACGVELCNMTEGGEGGATVGAGRRPNAEPTIAVQIRLTDDQHAALKSKGGSKWLKNTLDMFITGDCDDFLSGVIDEYGYEWLKNVLDLKLNEKEVLKCQLPMF